MLVPSALCPQTRATLWLPSQRELSLLKFARPFHAWAANWLQASLPSACDLSHWLHRAWATAERLAAQASRNRRTTAPLRPDQIPPSLEPSAFAAVVTAERHAYAAAGGQVLFFR